VIPRFRQQLSFLQNFALREIRAKVYSFELRQRLDHLEHGADLAVVLAAQRCCLELQKRNETAAEVMELLGILGKAFQHELLREFQHVAAHSREHLVFMKGASTSRAFEVVPGDLNQHAETH